MNIRKKSPALPEQERTIIKTLHSHFNMAERICQVKKEKETPSCLNCRKRKHCPERSREYPCREWKGVKGGQA